LKQQEDITDEQAIHILAMLVAAGAETTSTYLKYFFKAVAMHPEAAAKAQQGRHITSWTRKVVNNLQNSTE
jgi:cytochrome P450